MQKQIACIAHKSLEIFERCRLGKRRARRRTTETLSTALCQLRDRSAVLKIGNKALVFRIPWLARSGRKNTAFPIDCLLQGVDPDKQGRAVRKTLPRRYCRDLSSTRHCSVAAIVCRYSFGDIPCACASFLAAFEVTRHSPRSIRRSCLALRPGIAVISNPFSSRILRIAAP